MVAKLFLDLSAVLLSFKLARNERFVISYYNKLLVKNNLLSGEIYLSGEFQPCPRGFFSLKRGRVREKVPFLVKRNSGTSLSKSESIQIFVCIVQIN